MVRHICYNLQQKRGFLLEHLSFCILA
eukprot:COSAG06_NODE_38005_length_428_cov_1.170213_2_plen_26_part_01